LALAGAETEVPMASTRTKAEVLEQEFLVLRAKILEIAAGLDRLDRADGSLAGDPRSERLREAISLLLSDRSDRAREVQMLFSREFHPAWRKEFDL
jgi:hypothetical protein